MVIKRLDADFLQITSNAGPDGIVLGMKFRNEADTSNFAALLEQCTTQGDHKTCKRRECIIYNYAVNAFVHIYAII